MTRPSQSSTVPPQSLLYHHHVDLHHTDRFNSKIRPSYHIISPRGRLSQTPGLQSVHRGKTHASAECRDHIHWAVTTSTVPLILGSRILPSPKRSSSSCPPVPPGHGRNLRLGACHPHPKIEGPPNRQSASSRLGFCVWGVTRAWSECWPDTRP